MKTLLCTLMLATLCSAAAKADSITITFDKPTQAATPGGTLQFFGTITNNTSSTIFLNSDDLNMLGASFTTSDQFNSNVPFTLAPSGQAGSSSGDIELFDIVVNNPFLDPSGTYLGSYDLVGGIDFDAQDVLTVASFSAAIPPTASPMPEPSSIVLLSSGALAGLLTLSKRVRASRA